MSNLSAIDTRMVEIQESLDRQPGGYYGHLVDFAGSLRAAAVLDLAYDGELVWIDLRRTPFHDDVELKVLVKAAQEAQMALQSGILQRVWGR